MPRRRRKALPAASRSPAIAPRLSAPRPWRRHCGPRAYRRIRFRPRRRRRMRLARPIASRFSCCHDDDPDRTILVKPALKIAVAGLGTVGAGTLQLLARQAELLAVRAGRRIIVAAVSARDRRRDRGVDLSAVRWYEDAVAMAADPEIDAVVELIGGSDGVALAVIETALANKKHVVTANTLAILASVAFGRPVDLAGVYAEGIRHISRLDIDFAEELGYRIKLLGIARLTDHGLEQRVHPCMVPRETPIAAVEGVFNAVVAEGDFVGRVVLEGRGAGAFPTASSVAADLVDIASGRYVPAFGVPAASLNALPGAAMERHQGAYYIRLMVVDQPGVIADVAAALRDEHVSMESMIQRGRAPGEAVPVVLTTHVTVEAAMQRAIERIAALGSVLEPPRMIRIEDF